MEQEVYLEFDNLEASHWWFCGRRRYLERLISRLFPQAALGVVKLESVAEDTEAESLKFCEIGCGTGGNLNMLAGFALVDAVEMNPTARELVSKKMPVGIRQVIDGSLPSDISLKGSYDGVFSLDVIEHVEEDQAAIKRLAELAKPSAYIVTTVPAYQWLWSAHDVANHHKRRYTLSQYRQLFIDAGLHVHYASYFNTLLFPLAALSRLWGRLMSNGESEKGATLSMPNKYVNGLLNKIFSLESYWAGKISVPFGLSIVVVASHISAKID